MIRGVNRRVVEINECKSQLFERAIFFVRPDATDKSFAEMQKEANSIIEKLSMQPTPPSRKRYRISRRGIWLFFGLALTAAIVSTVLNFI